MILFYTLFPSVVNRIALIFSCRMYGANEFQKPLLTEALSVECWTSRHWTIIGVIGIPGVLVYVILIPPYCNMIERLQFIAWFCIGCIK